MNPYVCMNNTSVYVETGFPNPDGKYQQNVQCEVCVLDWSSSNFFEKKILTDIIQAFLLLGIKMFPKTYPKYGSGAK